MRPGRGIDHVVHAVRDLDRAGAVFARMGFTLTPPARHPFGTGNSLVQLEGNFVELLAVAEPAAIVPAVPGGFSFAAFNRDFLARREGISMLVFESADARADRDEFARAGLATYPVLDFSRAARLPDGGTATVGFSLAFVTDVRLPDAVFFVCQQHAPQHFWRREYMTHANGARAIVETVLVADDPPAYRDLFAGLQTPDAIATKDGGLEIATARGRVSVLDTARAARRFPELSPASAPGSLHFVGYRIAVADLAACAAALDAGAVPYRRERAVLRVAPADAFGAFVEFAA